MPLDERFKLYVLSRVREIGESFKEPDEDWDNALVMYAGEENIDETKVLLCDWETEREKLLYGRLIMPAAMRKLKATAYAFVGTTWAVIYERKTLTKPTEADVMEEFEKIRENEPPPSEHPNRREQVIVVFGCSTGEQELWMAEIHRTEDEPPTLDEWSKDIVPAGQFQSDLLKFVQLVAMKNGKEGA
jgi:hypothetical protein